MDIKLEHITKSHVPTKKYDAHITVNGRPNVIPFGAKGYSDYPTHRDKHRKSLEDWSDPRTPGFWSRWLLWNQPTLRDSEKSLRSRFGL